MRASASHRVPRASQHGAIFAESSYFGSVQLSPLRAPFLISSMLAIGTHSACVYLQWPLAAHAVGWMSSVTAPYQFCWQHTRRSIRPPVCVRSTQVTTDRDNSNSDGVRYTSHIPISALCGSLLSSTLPSRSRRSDAAYAARSTHRSPDHRWLPVWYGPVQRHCYSIAATLALLSSGVYCLWLHDAAARP